MGKFTADEKTNAVNRYENGVESIKAIAKSLGVDHSVLLTWIKRFEHHGVKAFIKEKGCTSYSIEDKLNILDYMKKNGASVRETAAIFHVASHGKLLSRKKSLELQGVDALQPKKGRSSVKKSQRN